MKKRSHLLIVLIFLNATSAFCQLTSFHGSEPPSVPPAAWSGHLKGNTIVRTNDGRYVVGGVIDESYVSGWLYLLKTSISGASSWQRVLSQTDSGKPFENPDQILSAREYDAGTIVATGNINLAGRTHALFLKIDENGHTLVKKGIRFRWLLDNDLEENGATCIEVVRNTSGAPIGTVLTGRAGTNGGWPAGFIHLTDGNGEPLATRMIHTPTRWVTQTRDGFLVLGTLGGNNVSVHKFSNDLTLQWQKTYYVETYYRMEPATITQVASAIYVTGTLMGSAFLMKLSADGTVNWAKTYGRNSTAQSLATKPDINGEGGLYLTGKIRSGGQDRAYILNTDFNGNRRWSRVYSLEDGPAEGREIIATADSLVVTGVSAQNMLLIGSDLRGFSGVPCESSVAMPTIPHTVTGYTFNTGRYRAPFYTELEPPKLNTFNVTAAFCDWNTTLPPYYTGRLDSSVVVYPTAVTSLLNIELKSPGKTEGSVTVFDTYTKLLTQKIPAGASKVTMDVSKLSPGLYYLVISIDGKETTKKFIKQ